MLPLLTSKPREPFSLLTGAQLVSRSVSTTNHQQLFQVVTWPKFKEPSACCLTPPPSLKPGLDSITNSISCTLREPSFTGMSVKVWKKVNSQKLEKIWPLSKKTTKKLVSTPSMAKTKVNSQKLEKIWPLSKK